MRLLDTTTLELKEFWGSQIPSYAILSHTWSRNSNDEVTLHDLRTGRARKKKAGFAKLRSFCELAKSHQLYYAWMDTCCIDKTSSAEESEAINSMYRWYERSTVCYAYLEDIQGDYDSMEANPEFQQSRWFTRGWTLQELIAAPNIYFFSANWGILGSKRTIESACGEESSFGRNFPYLVAPDLSMAISKITGINVGVLRYQLSPNDCSAAMRMSWAAFRQTTRPEDIAYCLMGIFNINMPALYGEG
ncbi:uncharacterized protein VB005_07917 [Metarhizium brunneum]